MEDGLSALDGAGQYAYAIGEQRTIDWLVDGGFDHGAVEAQLADARHMLLTRQGDDVVEQLLQRFGLDQIGPPQQRGVVGHASGVDAAELAQHQTVADPLLGGFVAPIVEVLDDEHAQDDLDGRGGTAEGGAWLSAAFGPPFVNAAHYRALQPDRRISGGAGPGDLAKPGAGSVLRDAWPAPAVADPLLQWASGLPTGRRTIYAGWLVEPHKDEALDGAMDAAGFTPITIKHGSGNLVEHWAVETATVFVVADGVQSIGEMKRAADRFGIAFGWRPVRTEGRGLRTERGGARDSVLNTQSSALKMQSQLRMRVFLRELLQVGYTLPLLLTVKGTLTGDLLAALMRQYDVLDTNAELRKQAKKEPWDLPFYAFSIPLSAGAEVTRGSGGATKELTPMVAAIPERVTREYLKAHWIGAAGSRCSRVRSGGRLVSQR